MCRRINTVVFLCSDGVRVQSLDARGRVRRGQLGSRPPAEYKLALSVNPVVAVGPTVRVYGVCTNGAIRRRRGGVRLGQLTAGGVRGGGGARVCDLDFRSWGMGARPWGRGVAEKWGAGFGTGVGGYIPIRFPHSRTAIAYLFRRLHELLAPAKSASALEPQRFDGHKKVAHLLRLDIW